MVGYCGIYYIFFPHLQPRFDYTLQSSVKVLCISKDPYEFSIAAKHTPQISNTCRLNLTECQPSRYI